jgi:hypothetical protein
MEASPSEASGEREPRRARQIFQRPADEPDGDGVARLEAACFVLGRCAGSGEEEPWSPASFQVAVADQVAALRRWADDEGLWLHRERLGILEEGGNEHDLLPEVETGLRFWKMTKKGRFGFRTICEPLIGTPSDEFPLRFATPLDYLRRLRLHNELVEHMNWLEGFLRTDQGISIVTSQRFIRGEKPSDREVRRYFEGHGFRPVCTGSWYQPDRNLAVFDVGEHNFVSCDGVIVPVDVIPVRPTGRFLERVRLAAG